MARWAGALLLILPSAAWAFGLDAPANDIATQKILQPVFGSLFGGSGSSALGGMFGQLNALALLIGSVITMYGFLAGTMATAHDGAVLGKKWSSMWVPIRLAVGISLMLPMSGGWCGAQMMVAWLAGQGMAGAGLAFDAYNKEYIAPQSALSIPQVDGIHDLASKVLASASCVAQNNAASKASDGSSIYASSAYGDIGVNGGVRSYGTSYKAADCGVVRFSGAATGNQDTAQISSSISQAHVKAFYAMESDLMALAKDIQASTSGGQRVTDAANRYDQAIAKYQQTVTAAAQGAQGSGSDYSKSVAGQGSGGFIQAGFAHIKQAVAGRAMATSLAATPSANGGVPAAASNIDVRGAIATSKAAVSGERSFMQKVGDTASSAWSGVRDSVAGAVDVVSGGLDGIMSAANSIISALDPKVLVSNFSNALIEGTIAKMDEGGDPFVSASNFGNSILFVFDGLLIVVGVLAVMSFGGNAAGLFTSPLGVALSAMTLSAVTAAIAMIFLFMVPMMIWISFVIGYLALLVEALCAAPLLAALMLAPDEEGITGRANRGLTLLGALVLRPILGLIGLAASFMIAKVACGLLGEHFLPMLKAAQGDSVTGLVIAVAGICTYAMAKYSIIVRCMGLTHTIPDAVLGWFGGGGGAHGNITGAIDREADGHHAGGGAFIGAMVTGAGRMKEKEKPGNNDKGVSERNGAGGDDGDGGPKGGPKGGGSGPKGGRQSPSGDPQGGKSVGGVGGMSSNPSAGFAGGNQETGGQDGGSKEEGGSGGAGSHGGKSKDGENSSKDSGVVGKVENGIAEAKFGGGAKLDGMVNKGNDEEIAKLDASIAKGNSERGMFGQSGGEGSSSGGSSGRGGHGGSDRLSRLGDGEVEGAGQGDQSEKPATTEKPSKA